LFFQNDAKWSLGNLLFSLNFQEEETIEEGTVPQEIDPEEPKKGILPKVIDFLKFVGNLNLNSHFRSWSIDIRRLY
jgi:hypothetical protein